VLSELRALSGEFAQPLAPQPPPSLAETPGFRHIPPAGAQLPVIHTRGAFPSQAGSGVARQTPAEAQPDA